MNRKEYLKEYYIKNKERMKECPSNNKEYRKEWARKYYLKNKEKIDKDSKLYHLTNREFYVQYCLRKYHLRARENKAQGLTCIGTPFKWVNGINLSKIRNTDGKVFGSPYLPKIKQHSAFYKQYGMTLEEMGKRVGITKEAVRQRFIKGLNVQTIGNQTTRNTKTGRFRKFKNE